MSHLFENLEWVMQNNCVKLKERFAGPSLPLNSLCASSL